MRFSDRTRSTVPCCCVRPASWCAGVLLCSCWLWTRDAGAQVKLDALPGSSGVGARGQAGGQTGGVPALVRPSRALAQDIRASKEPIISDAFAVNDARGEFLIQMRRGELTPEAAWDKGWLTKENVLKIAGLWRDWSQEGKTLRVHLVGLLAEKAPEVLSPDALLPQNDGSGPIVLSSEDAGEAGTGAKQAVGLEAWSEWKRIVGEYFRQQKDARAVVWYEAALKDWQQARAEKAQARKLVVGGFNGTSSQVSRDKYGTIKQDGDPTWVNGVGGLAFYYAETGQLRKAAQTWERAPTYSKNLQWLADAGAEAVGLYVQVGDEAKARELAAQVQSYGNGWFTGITQFDRARGLIAQGKHEEARELLQQPVLGQRADQMQPILLSELSQSYYITGDFELAQQYARSAINSYQALPVSKLAIGLQEVVSQSEERLKWIARWQREPIICAPRHLSVSANPDEVQSEIIVRRFFIRTLRPVPLNIISDNSLVSANVTQNALNQVNQDYFSQQEVTVKIAPQATKQGVIATLLISSPQVSGFQTQVPVSVLEVPNVQFTVMQ